VDADGAAAGAPVLAWTPPAANPGCALLPGAQLLWHAGCRDTSGMELLAKAGEVLLGWTALSLLAAVGWSRFMTQLRHKERRLAADRARHVWRARRERDRLARAS
jgi:hypothetical protein